MTLIPFLPKRFTDSELFITELDGRKCLVKSYLGEAAGLRRDLERAKLKRWKAGAFRVPEVIDAAQLPLTAPYLVIEYLPAVNLSDALKDPTLSYEAKRALLAPVFGENAKRHSQALEANDVLLVHTDPNTDNILLLDSSHVTIDFEHPGKKREILEAIAHEVATFSRRVLTDLGREHLQDMVGLMCQSYAQSPLVLEQLCQLTLGRKFQFYHRFKDRQKKAKKPGLVTNYDIADSVSVFLLRGH